jgi:hypothetical protein
MNRLTRIIAPLLSKAGLDGRAVGGSDGDIRELIVTSPRYPSWGCVLVDREGHMQWDYWGNAATDHGAADIATLVAAIIGQRRDGADDHNGQAAYLSAPEERGQSFP